MRISVFGSSSCNPVSLEYQIAYQIGRLLGERNSIVVNGGRTGIMEAVSMGATKSGGEVWGVARNPKSYCNRYLTRTIICDPSGEESYEFTINMRTGRLLESDCFIAILGPKTGEGTIKEICGVVECEFGGWDRKRPLALLYPEVRIGTVVKMVSDIFGTKRNGKVLSDLTRSLAFENWLRIFPDNKNPDFIGAVNFATGHSK